MIGCIGSLAQCGTFLRRYKHDRRFVTAMKEVRPFRWQVWVWPA